MRVRIEFTLDIPENQLERLAELCAADSRADIRAFLKGEAEDHLTEYLRDNGIWPEVIRR